MILHDNQIILNLRGSNLSAIPTDIADGKLSAVIRIDLAHNSLRSFIFLSAYTGLVELDLSDNQIESLDGIKVLSRLESLHLKCNKITTFEDIGSLSKLIHLDVSYNMIASFSDLDYLKRGCPLLHRLCIQGNPGSNLADTRLRLVGFVSLLHLHIGAGSKPHRLHLVHALPHMQTIDEIYITDEERRDLCHLDLKDIYIPDPTECEIQYLPDPDTLKKVNDESEKLRQQLAEAVAKIQRLEQERNEYNEFVSVNLQKLAHKMAHSKHDFESEKVRLERAHESLKQQLHQVTVERDSLREDLQDLEKKYRDLKLSSQKVEVQENLEIEMLREELHASTSLANDLRNKRQNLLQTCGNLLRMTRNHNRVRNVLFENIESLYKMLVNANSSRRETLERCANLKSLHEHVLESVVETTGRVIDMQRSVTQQKQDLSHSLTEGREQKQRLETEIVLLRKEYSESVKLIDDRILRKVVKHEKAVEKLYSMYNTEKCEGERLRAELAESLKHARTLETELERVRKEVCALELCVNTQQGRDMELGEKEAEMHVLRRKLELKDGELDDINETLEKTRTSIKVKDEVIADLSSQIRSLRAAVAETDDTRNAEYREQIEKLKNELTARIRETDGMNKQILHTESLVQQKEEMLQYITAEVSGIKESYEAKLTIQEKANFEESSRMRTKLTEAARALLELEKQLNDSLKQNQLLQLKLENEMEEKSRLQKLNSQKISQIKSILGERDINVS